MGPQSQVNIVLYFQIFRVCQVFNLEETLHLGNAFLCQVDDFILLIDDKISGLFPFHAHNGIHFGQRFHIGPAL